MSESAARIFDLLSVFQRKNQFIGTSSRTDLSLLESHLLGEVAGSPGANVGDLLSRLRVEGSMLSRAIDSLAGRKLVNVTRPGRDRRQRCVTLSSQGHEALKQLDRNANALLALFTRSFSKPEIVRLSKLLLALSDGMQAPGTSVRREDHPLRPGLRRLARALSIIGSRYLGSEISSSQFQVLLSIREECGLATASSLQDRLRIHQSTLSRMISQLTAAGYISHRASESDQRARSLSLTAKGRALSDGIRTEGAARIARASEPLSKAQVGQLEQLLERLVFAGAEKGSFSLEDGAAVWRLRSGSELRAGRAALVELLVTADRHRQLGASLLPASHTVYALGSKRELAAICELAGTREEIVLENLAGGEELSRSWRYLAFVKLCFRQALSRTPKARLFLPNRERYILPAYPVEWLSATSGGLSLGSVPFP